MGIFFPARRALRDLDKYGVSTGDKNHLKKFQSIVQRANKSFFVPITMKRNLSLKVDILAHQLGEKKVDPVQLAKITAEAAKWKQRQVAFGKNTALTDEDKEKLEAITRYKNYLPYVNWAHFFKWTLLNKQSVDIFTQFPPVVKRINRSLLAARVGTFGGLEYVEEGGAKDVKLLFDGKLISILDKKRRITFSSGLTASVDEVFQSFGKKQLKEGIFTYLKDKGIVPWDSFEMGYVDDKGNVKRLDLTRKDWHKQLPMLEKNIPAEEATKRFGKDCDGKNWVLTLVCRRKVKCLDAFGSHSFLRLLIPNGDGTYDYTYGWGKFAKKYAQNFVHALTFLFNPKQGTMQYPDNNEIYTNRETLELHYLLKPDTGDNCLQSFKDDLQKSYNGQFIFQLLLANCSDWVVGKIRQFVDLPKPTYQLDEKLGKLESQIMDIAYIYLNPRGLCGLMMKMLRASPDWFRRGFLCTGAILTGGWKSMGQGADRVCVLETPPWDLKRPFRHPGRVFQKIHKIA